MVRPRPLVATPCLQTPANAVGRDFLLSEAAGRRGGAPACIGFAARPARVAQPALPFTHAPQQQRQQRRQRQPATITSSHASAIKYKVCEQDITIHGATESCGACQRVLDPDGMAAPGGACRGLWYQHSLPCRQRFQNLAFGDVGSLSAGIQARSVVEDNSQLAPPPKRRRRQSLGEGFEETMQSPVVDLTFEEDVAVHSEARPYVLGSSRGRTEIQAYSTSAEVSKQVCMPSELTNDAHGSNSLVARGHAQRGGRGVATRPQRWKYGEAPHNEKRRLRGRGCGLGTCAEFLRGRGCGGARGRGAPGAAPSGPVAPKIPGKIPKPVKAANSKVRGVFISSSSLLAVGSSHHAFGASEGDIRGHYDVLGLARSATVEEIRRAFKLKALKAHPDKGGSAEEFHRALAAFEVLANESTRLTYDAELRFRDSSDGQGRAEGAFCQPRQRRGAATMAEEVREASGSARATLERVKMGDAVDLRNLCAAESLALQQLLAAERELRATRHRVGRNEGGLAAPAKLKGISRRAGEVVYQANVQAKRAHFSTERTPSLEQAIDWHIAITKLVNLSHSKGQMDVGADTDVNTSASPFLIVTEEDWLTVQADEPSLLMMGRWVFHAHGSSWRTPVTADVRQFIQNQAAVVAALVEDNRRVMDLTIERLMREALETRRLRKARQDALPEAISLACAERTWLAEREATGARRLAEALRLSPEDAAGVAVKLEALPPQEFQKLRTSLLMAAPDSLRALAGSSGPGASGPRAPLAALLALEPAEVPPRPAEPAFLSAPRGANGRTLSPLPWALATDAARKPLRWLSLAELGRLRAVAASAAAAADAEAWDKSLRHFRYDAAICSDVTTLGAAAALQPALGRAPAARSLMALFGRSRFLDFFQQLDLSRAPALVLEDPSLHAAMARLPYVKHVALPQDGWSDPDQRLRVQRALQPGVVVTFGAGLVSSI